MNNPITTAAATAHPHPPKGMEAGLDSSLVSGSITALSGEKSGTPKRSSKAP